MSIRALLWPTLALSGRAGRTYASLGADGEVMVWPMSSCSSRATSLGMLSSGLQQPLGETVAVMGELAGQRLIEFALALDPGAEQQAGEALGPAGAAGKSRDDHCQA